MNSLLKTVRIFLPIICQKLREQFFVYTVCAVSGPVSASRTEAPPFYPSVCFHDISQKHLQDLQAAVGSRKELQWEKVVLIIMRRPL